MRISQRKKYEQHLIDAFKQDNSKLFIENLYYLIQVVFSNNIILIKKILNFDDSNDILNEIIVKFFDSRFNSIKDRFSDISIDPSEFLSVLYLAIKHSIRDILSEYNDVYKIKQFLRKETVKYLKISNCFILKGKCIHRISKTGKNDILIRKPSNLLGIPLKDIEILLSIIIRDSDPILLDSLVDRAFQYLTENGYIVINKNIDIDNIILPKKSCSDKLLKKDLSVKIVDIFVENITENEKQIFYLYFVMENKLHDVAKKLKMSKGIVMYHKKKLVTLLDSILQDIDKDKIDKELFSLIIEEFNRRVAQ